MGLPAPVGYLYWYTSSIILFLLTLLNISTKLYRYLHRPRNIRRLSLPESPGYNAHSNALVPAESPSSSDHTCVDEKVRSPSSPALITRYERALRACTVLTSKYLGLTALPYPNLRLKFWKKVKRQGKRAVPTPELLWMGGYTVGCLVLSFYGTGWDIKTYSNQAAWLACAQVPMIIALAGKNNLIAFLTGIPYDRLNYLHRAAGRLCLLGVWIHAGGHWYLMKGWTSANWHSHISQWGFTGTFAFTLMTFVSSPWFRRRMFEFFLVAHVLLAALSLAAFIMHWRAVDVWIYPGIGLWAADRIFRALRLTVLNKLWLRPTLNASNIPSRATLTTLTPSTILISFPSPAKGLKWSAGHHFYVVMPGMSRLPWEAHPFTAITIPRKSSDSAAGTELSFIVRVRDGFTKRMKDKIDEVRKEHGLTLEDKCEISVPAAVEGPYGEPTDFSGYEAVLIFAGGSGISFAVANLLQIIQDVSAGKSLVRVVEIVWMVKSRLHLDWISPILLASIQAVPPNLSITLHVHVTRQVIPRMSLSGSSDWQTYLAENASGRKRRRSRFMSTFSWATFRSDGSWGRRSNDGGTRRGSIMPPPEPSKKKRGSKAAASANADKRRTSGVSSGVSSGAESDAESSSDARSRRTSVAVPAFTWTEGYAEGPMPGATPNVSPDEEPKSANGFKFSEPFAHATAPQSHLQPKELELEIVVAQPTPTDGVAPTETFAPPIPVPDELAPSEAGDPLSPIGETETDPFDSPTAPAPAYIPGRRSSSVVGQPRARMSSPVAAYGRRTSQMSDGSDSSARGSLSGPGQPRRGSGAWYAQAQATPNTNSPTAPSTPPPAFNRGSFSGGPRRMSITIDEPIIPPRRGSTTASTMLSDDAPPRKISVTLPLMGGGRRPSTPNLLMQATAHSMQRSGSGGVSSSLSGGSLAGASAASTGAITGAGAGAGAGVIAGRSFSPRGSLPSSPLFNAHSSDFGERRDSHGSPVTKPTSILIPTPVLLQPAPILDPSYLQPHPQPHSTSNESDGPSDMSRSSSANSGLSMASFSDSLPPSPSALAPPSEISRPGTPNIDFKQLQEVTGTLDDPARLRKSIVALDAIPDPKERRQSIDVVLGPAEGVLRRRGSMGLEAFVKWHEGRADIPGILKETMDRIAPSSPSLPSVSAFGPGRGVDVEKAEKAEKRSPSTPHQAKAPKGAPKVIVGACGPKSLLDAAKNAVRAEMTAGRAWRGEVGVDFHAETFGW